MEEDSIISEIDDKVSNISPVNNLKCDQSMGVLMFSLIRLNKMYSTIGRFSEFQLDSASGQYLSNEKYIILYSKSLYILATSIPLNAAKGCNTSCFELSTIVPLSTISSAVETTLNEESIILVQYQIIGGKALELKLGGNICTNKNKMKQWLSILNHSLKKR